MQVSVLSLKTIGAGVVAAQRWSKFEEILHIQGQRRSPSKMAEGAKSCLESNPIPARDTEFGGLKQNLVCTRKPYRD